MGLLDVYAIITRLLVISAKMAFSKKLDQDGRLIGILRTYSGLYSIVLKEEIWFEFKYAIPMK